MTELTESEIHEQNELREIARNLCGGVLTPRLFHDEFKDEPEVRFIIQRLVFLYGVTLRKWKSEQWKLIRS